MHTAHGKPADRAPQHIDRGAVKCSACQTSGASRSLAIQLAGRQPIKWQQTLAADGMFLARSMVEHIVDKVAICLKLALQLTVEVHDHSRCHMFLNVSDLLVVAFHL